MVVEVVEVVAEVALLEEPQEQQVQLLGNQLLLQQDHKEP